MAIQLEVWGDYALFTRPEMKVERVSYDVMTPSAARGILEAIYWHPGMKWIVDRIHVCNPVKFTNVRRNEVTEIISVSNVKSVMKNGKGEIYLATSNNRAQRASMMLQDVHYVIDAHFEMTDKAAPGDNPGKFQDIIRRRVEKGQYYHMPYFGTRECPVKFSLCEVYPEVTEELKGRKDLGFMLWDMDYISPDNIQPLFFRAIMNDGIIDVPSRISGEVLG